MTQQIVDYIHQHIEDLKLVYLFGSRAQGVQTAHSDWDLAILSGQNLSFEDWFALREALANALVAEVDLIDLRNTTTVMQMQVIQNGTCLWGEQDEVDRFELAVMAMYSDLQERRQDIIRHFKSRISEIEKWS